MIPAFYLAFRYISYHRSRTALLIAATTLTLMLPVATRWTIERFRAQALNRAHSTPLLVGAKGSGFALTLHALYFRGDTPPSVPYSLLTRIDQWKLGQSLPLLARYRAQGHLIVGTSEQYLSFRQLTLAAGEPLERWGDCLVGSKVAQELGIKVGEGLLSDPGNMLDLSGPAPLRMRVRGILNPTGTADDEVIFCHLETTWIMGGIGHGHIVANAARDALPGPSTNMEGQSEDGRRTEEKESQAGSLDYGEGTQAGSLGYDGHAHSAENLQRYSEVTSDNLRSFHFHGDRQDYPLTAIIVRPDSERSAALLEGKFLSPQEPSQVVSPSQIIRDLLQVVARVQQLLDAVSLMLGAATLLLMGLVMTLSVRLRAAEIHTLKLLGASRWQIARIMAAELTLITATSLLAALALASLLVYNLDVIQTMV